MVSRRALLAGIFASACSRKRATRYQGWLFVASGAEKEIAVADLSTFRRISTISLPSAPDQLFSSGNLVYALCREARTILEIDAGNFRVAAKTSLPGKPVAARLLSDKAAVVACEDPGRASSRRSGEPPRNCPPRACPARPPISMSTARSQPSPSLRRIQFFAPGCPMLKLAGFPPTYWCAVHGSAFPPRRENHSGGSHRGPAGCCSGRAVGQPSRQSCRCRFHRRASASARMADRCSSPVRAPTYSPS